MMIIFVVWLTKERRLALFSTGSIVRDPPNPQFFDTLRAGFEPAQKLSSGLVYRSYTVVITTSPLRHIC